MTTERAFEYRREATKGSAIYGPIPGDVAVGTSNSCGGGVSALKCAASAKPPSSKITAPAISASALAIRDEIQLLRRPRRSQCCKCATPVMSYTTAEQRHPFHES